MDPSTDVALWAELEVDLRLVPERHDIETDRREEAIRVMLDSYIDGEGLEAGRRAVRALDAATGVEPNHGTVKAVAVRKTIKALAI